MALTAERLARLQQLFEAAVELAPEDRDALLEREGREDPSLAEEVRGLLAAHDSSLTAFDRPVTLARLVESVPDETRWTGARLGPWQLTRLIGHGGMGTVFEAVRADGQFNKRAAIKFLHRHARGAPAVERFRAERQILASLDHPNIATLIDGGVTEDGQPYLVMEYIDGEPINAWAQSRGLSCRERVALFLQACAAVEAAHQALVVHRDLKPANILVSAEGRVKLLDFGIARLLDAQAVEGGIAEPRPEVLAFTPDYAAPEQMRAEPASTTMDVFALGAVLYQLLTGRLPFADRRHPLQPAAPADLDADLDAILARALQPDAAVRYASVADLRQDLIRWRDDLPVQARPATSAYRMRKFVRRHRTGTLVGTAAMVLILGATVVALWQADAARRAARDQGLMKDFLFEVLRMSNPYDQGDELTLSAALDQAALAIDTRFAGRRDLAAEIRYGIGYSMVDRYRLEQAEAQLQRALDDGIAAFGASDLRVLRVVEAIAGLRMEQSRFEEAEAGYRACIAALEREGHTRDTLYARAVGNLGNLYLIVERYEEALALLRQAEAVHDAHGTLEPYDHATLLSNLAHAAHGVEDLPLAEQLYTQAAEALQALFPDGSPDLAIIYNNHAMLREESGAVDAALQMHRESLAMRRKVFRNSHPMIVSSLANMARLQLRAGDAAGALQSATEGAQMADAVYTEPNRFHPSVNATLAAALLANGDAVAARAALVRAHARLAELPDAPPSTTRWVEEVSGQYCAKVGPRDALCRMETGRTMH